MAIENLTKGGMVVQTDDASLFNQNLKAQGWVATTLLNAGNPANSELFEFRDPNSLFQSTWGSNPEYTNLVYATRYPTAPSGNPFVTAADSDDNEEHIVGLQACELLSVITRIEVYIYSVGAGGQADMTGKLYVGGSLAGSVAIPCTGTEGWSSFTVSTGWVRSQLQTGFRIGLLSPTIGKLGACYWMQAYAKLFGR